MVELAKIRNLVSYGLQFRIVNGIGDCGTFKISYQEIKGTFG